MRDLAAVDRQLAELAGELPIPDRRNVRALLGRLLGSDRSLARLNELLDGFGSIAGAATPRPAPLRDPLGGAAQRASASMRAPARATANGEPTAEARSEPPPGAGQQQPALQRANPPGVRGSLPPRIVSPLAVSPLAPVQGDSLKTATPWPPVASVSTSPPPAFVPAPAAARSARDTLVDAAVPPPAMPQVDEVELDAATRALFGITEVPAALSTAPDAAPTAVPADAHLPAEEEQRPDKRRKTLQWGSGVEPVAVLPELITNASGPASAASPATRADERENRQSIRALLDQEIDPRDFPSSHPPRPRSMPPPLSKQPPPAVAKDSFEMLIDDEAEEDIIEIDDMELEEIE